MPVTAKHLERGQPLCSLVDEPGNAIRPQLARFTSNRRGPSGKVGFGGTDDSHLPGRAPRSWFPDPVLVTRRTRPRGRTPLAMARDRRSRG